MLLVTPAAILGKILHFQNRTCRPKLLIGHLCRLQSSLCPAVSLSVSACLCLCLCLSCQCTCLCLCLCLCRCRCLVALSSKSLCLSSLCPPLSLCPFVCICRESEDRLNLSHKGGLPVKPTAGWLYFICKSGRCIFVETNGVKTSQSATADGSDHR